LDIDETEFPRNLGINTFIKKYHAEFPKIIERYHPDHWELTQELEQLGSTVLPTYDRQQFRTFLLLVYLWKNPHGSALRTALLHTIRNNRYAIDRASRQVRIGLINQDDVGAVAAFSHMVGFGKHRRTPMISAVLRFLAPDRYGTVDYRNWSVLSNTQHSFFDSPLVKPLAPTFLESKRQAIDSSMYLDYLKIIRTLAVQCNVRPADVDMALFAFSDRVRSLQAIFYGPHHFGRAKRHAVRMLAHIWLIIETAWGVGLGGPAEILLERALGYAVLGDFLGLYRECKRMVAHRPEMDREIEKRATSLGLKEYASVRTQLDALAQISYEAFASLRS